MRHSTMLATAAFATLLATSAFAADLPGKGITVKPAQSTISEESFQTLLVSRALEKLGYTVEKPSEVDYNVAYTSIAAGDTTFIATNWQPLHDDMYAAAGGYNKFYRKGVYVPGAAQGYLIDKKPLSSTTSPPSISSKIRRSPNCLIPTMTVKRISPAVPQDGAAKQ